MSTNGDKHESEQSDEPASASVISPQAIAHWLERISHEQTRQGQQIDGMRKEHRAQAVEIRDARKDITRVELAQAEQLGKIMQVHSLAAGTSAVVARLDSERENVRNAAADIGFFVQQVKEHGTSIEKSKASIEKVRHVALENRTRVDGHEKRLDSIDRDVNRAEDELTETGRWRVHAAMEHANKLAAENQRLRASLTNENEDKRKTRRELVIAAVKAAAPYALPLATGVVGFLLSLLRGC